MCCRIFKMEGSAQEVLYQKKNLKVLAKEYNPVFAGSSQGKSGYNLTLAIAYIRDFLWTKYHWRNLRECSSMV